MGRCKRRYIDSRESTANLPSTGNTLSADANEILPYSPPELPSKVNLEVGVASVGANGRLPAKIAILGRVMPDRRNYQAIIDDFYKAILGTCSLALCTQYCDVEC